MSRPSEDARTRVRRHRAAVALRSQTVRAADDLSSADSDGSGFGFGSDVSLSLRGLPVHQPESSPEPVSAASLPPRRPRRRRATFDPARLYDLVAARNAATAAVDAEVRRLRRLGASWPQLAAALGVSRQAARERYGP